MNINENITITLAPADVTTIINEYLAGQGYAVDNVSYNITEECRGWPHEYYVKVFQGATCKVTRKG